jgi:Flp pilus assembly protein TadG
MAKALFRRKGNSTIEFTLVGLPLLFALVSIFEMSRGMWIYHTLAYAVKEGTRYAVVHGQNCGIEPNHCQVRVMDIAQHVKDAGIGLDPNQLTITLTSSSRSPVTCSPLTSCLSNGDIWPDYPDNQAGLSIGISARIPFRSAIAMFWPGGGKGVNFGEVWFPAASQETVQF